jgi:hypothetical protein
MGLRFYFSSPIKMGMDMGIPELYGFGESKIRSRCGVAMPTNHDFLVVISTVFNIEAAKSPFTLMALASCWGLFIHLIMQKDWVIHFLL